MRPADVEDVAIAIVRLIEDPAWARQLGAAARQTVVERFSLDVMVRKYEQLYEDVACH